MAASEFTPVEVRMRGTARPVYSAMAHAGAVHLTTDAPAEERRASALRASRAVVGSQAGSHTEMPETTLDTEEEEDDGDTPPATPPP